MPIELEIMCVVGVLGIIAVLVFAILTHPDNVDKPWREPMKLWLRNVGIWILLGLAFGFALGSVRSAKAHDNPDNWIGQERRKNAEGVLCCGAGDCHAYTVDEVKVMPDGYHFPDGEIVSFGKAAPSIDHFYWKCVWGGETKCVFAPLGAS